ncbi:MAG: tetratricopeptide repeat protein [Chloroflexota bacterium]|nr:tetratricopeptide repeat protein [Chloroflexota bacterium]
MSSFDVFISYSRKDTDFVRQLFDALEAQNRPAWVDWQGIDYSTKWWEEICAGIDSAQNFVFVISQDALNSKYCHDEITHARKHGKRIIPLELTAIDEARWTRQPLTDQALDNWTHLRTLQFISLPKLGSFDAVVTALLETADKDPLHVKTHTELLAAAAAWQTAGKSPGFLLSAERLQVAEAWLAAWDALPDSNKTQPRPTDEQRAFIAACRAAEDAAARLKAEQEQRTRDLETQTERAAAENVTLSKRTRRFRLAAAVAAVVGALALVATGVAVQQGMEAGERAAEAVSAQTTSTAQVATAISQLDSAEATATNIPPTLTRAAVIAATAEYDQNITERIGSVYLSVLLSSPESAENIETRNSNTTIRTVDQLIADFPNDTRVYFAAAFVYTSANDLEAAIEAFTNALEIDPDNLDALLNRGVLYLGTGEYDRAIRDATRAIELSPYSAPAYTLRGQALYFGERDYLAAIEDFNRSIEIDPTDGGGYFLRAQAYYKLENYESAITDYTQAIALNARVTDAYLWRGLAYHQTQEYEAAIDDFTEVAALDRQNANAYFYRANSYSAIGNLDAAIEDYTRVIELNSENVSNAYFNRGNAFRNQGNYAAAIDDYTRLIEINPQDSGAYNNRGDVYSRQGNHENAIADFTRAIELSPENAFAYNNRGNSLLALGHYDQAIQDYTRAIGLDSRYARPYFGRGDAYYALNEKNLAFADYRSATQLDAGFAIMYFSQFINSSPDNPIAFYIRGLAYAVTQNYDLSITDFSTAIELNEQRIDEAFFLVGRAESYRLSGEYLNAVEDYTDAIAIEPSADRYNRRGLSFVALQRYSEAIEDFTSAIELAVATPAPFQALYLSNRGNAYRLSGQHLEAIEDYTDAIAMDPTGDRYNRRGISLYALERYDEAIADYTSAIELDTGNPANEALYLTNRGNAHRDNEDYEAAIADYTAAIELQPTAIRYNLRGNVYNYNLQDYDAAIADYTNALELVTDNPSDEAIFLTNRGEAYRRSVQYELALTDYTAAIAIEPTVDRYYRRGISLQAIERYDEAITDYTRAIELNADNEVNEALYLTTRGNAYRDNEEYSTAIENYNDALALDAGYLPALRGRGITYYWLEDYENALADFAAANVSSPLAFNFDWIGLIHFITGEFQQAENAYTNGLDLDAEYASLYANRALLYWQMGDTDAALADYLTSIGLDPNRGFVDGQAYSVSPNSSNFLLRQYSRVLGVYPDNIIAQLLRANIYANTGEFELAVADYEIVIEALPEFAPAIRSLADCYYQLEQFDDAQRFYEQYLELVPDAEDSALVRERLAELMQQ